MRWAAVLGVLALCGCAGLAQDKLRLDASKASGCAQERVVISDWSPDVSRVDACGDALVCYYRSSTGDRTDQLMGIGGYWECKER